MSPRAEVDVTWIVKILTVILLISIEYSQAWPGVVTTWRSDNNFSTDILKRPGNDTSKGSKFHYSVVKEFDDLYIENNILNGIGKPNDDRKTGQIIFEVLKNNPEHIALIDADTGKQTTNREILYRSIRLALWMKKQGVRPNDIIVSCTHDHLDSYIPLLATLFVDAIFSGWSQDITLYTARRFTNILLPKLIFTNEKAADVILEAVSLENSTARSIVFGKHPKFSSFSDIINTQTQNDVYNFELANENSPQDGAFILFTSGSSGFPKAVVLPNTLLASPALNTIVDKGTRILQPSQKSIESFYHVIQKYEVNWVFLPLSVLNDLAKSGSPKNYDLRSLKMIFGGGSKISKEIYLGVKREFPGAFVGQGYGLTEVSAVLASTHYRSKHVEAAGILTPNCKAKIVDTNSGVALGPNKIGELYAKAPTMMIAYYKNPEATKRSIDAQGWFHTGDLAYYDESGEIFITGRMKEVITYKNHRILPAEIEEILMSHPQVQEVAVVPIPVGDDGDRPVAFVQIAPGSQVTKDELVKLTSVLEDYKKLADIHFMKIPHLPSGKVSKSELTELANELAKNKLQS